MEAPRIAPTTPRSSYDLSGKSLLTAVLILLSSVLLVLSLHALARCYVLRRSRSRRRRIPLYFRPPPPVLASDHGLDPAILSSLPVLPFSTSGPDECAVCLCDFEDGDRVRVLPGCSHTFHVECIDMWFFSHSTCPLCRSTIDSIVPPDLCVLCLDDEEASATPDAALDEAPSSDLDAVGWNEAVLVDREEEKALRGWIAAIKSILNWDLGFHCGGDLESGGGEGERQ